MQKGGSLFLFNKRVLCFFRKDGLSWLKKNDGKTVGEAHERLKVGNVEALNCYYAHGETNPNFQRRSYWMLDPLYDYIVLVHYSEIREEKQVLGHLMGALLSHLFINVGTKLGSWASHASTSFVDYESSAMRILLNFERKQKY